MHTTALMAYRRGYTDRLRQLRMNPYPPGSPIARLWCQGWRHADLECLDDWKWWENVSLEK